jgi:hypothetical protein
MEFSRNGFRGNRSLLLPVVAAVVLAAAGAGAARGEVSVNINLGPPPIVVAEPPAVVLVPESRVYFVPDPHIDVFFYDGYWWSPRGERWYRARAYNGPWVVMERSRVPRSVIYMPRDYRARYERERHVPYGQWKKEHGRWDRENRKAHKRWEKEREKEWKEREKRERHERRGDHGRRDDSHGDRDRRGNRERR